MHFRESVKKFGQQVVSLPLFCLVAFMCLLISPAPSQSVESTPFTEIPLVVGHRGASGYRPEHTLAAYSLALEQGADYIEPDLVSTADGVLVARHESEISLTTDVAAHPEFAARRTTKTIDGVRVAGWFTENFTLAELKTLRAHERIPEVRAANAAFDQQFEIATLPEIIALVRSTNERRNRAARARGVASPPPVGIYAELKHPAYFRKLGKPLEEPLVDALREAGFDAVDAPVIVQTFEPGSLRRLKRMSHVRLVQLIDRGGAPADVRESRSGTYADMITPAGLADIASYAYGINVAKELVIPRREDGTLGRSTSLVHDAHAQNLRVHIWTFRAENCFLPSNLRKGTYPGDPGKLDREIHSYLAAGADGIFSDNPDIAVRARKRMAST